MAKKRVIGRPFVKGKSGNPEGARLHNPDLKRIKRMTQTELAQIGTMLLKENLRAIEELAESREAPALKVWMATVIKDSIANKALGPLETILDRTVGRVVDQVKFTDDRDPRSMTPEDKEKRIQELIIARGVLNEKRKG